MTTTWLIQDTKHPTPTVRRLIRSCAEHGRPVLMISVSHGSTVLPGILAEPPFVFYGYSTLLVNAHRDIRFRPGVFFDPDLFRPSAYQARWGDMLFNRYQFATVAELTSYWSGHPDERFFVKPDDDLKGFTGGVLTYGQFMGVPDLYPADALAFCPPAEAFPDEFRVVMAGGHAVSASTYRPDADAEVPGVVLEFAEAVSRLWQPAPVYVLDVAYSQKHSSVEPRIIEANCFNGSGLYNADVSEIVRQVSRYQELHHPPSVV